MQFQHPATDTLPLCRPAGWAALWRRLANCAALNA
jgi:hypothetical protein